MFDGCTVNASRVAAPVVTLKFALIVPVKPVAVAAIVYPAPDLAIERLAKVATPAITETVCRPASAPPGPASEPIATVICVELSVLTVAPSASRTATCTVGIV